MTTPIDLPITVVLEIIKNSLDEDVILSKNTKVAFSRIGGVFILYISNLANEICKSKGKSKITVKDVLEAMDKAGFSNFKPEIEALLFNIEKDTSANVQSVPKKRQVIDDNDIPIAPISNKEVKRDTID